MEVEVLSITISERVTAADGEVYVRVDRDDEYSELNWFPTMGGGAFMMPDALDNHDDLEAEYQASRFGFYEKIEDNMQNR